MEKTTYNLYNYNKSNQTDEASGPAQRITFYKLNQDGSSEPGTTLEEMLRVSIQRLRVLNERFSCRENSIAITKMQEALLWLNERTRDRKERGVDGRHEA